MIINDKTTKLLSCYCYILIVSVAGSFLSSFVCHKILKLVFLGQSQTCYAESGKKRRFRCRNCRGYGLRTARLATRRGSPEDIVRDGKTGWRRATVFRAAHAQRSWTLEKVLAMSASIVLKKLIVDHWW